jgi:NADH dehydrogenase
MTDSRTAAPPREAVSGQRPRVVIVGAGFAGLSAARALARAPVELTVIDRHNYHLFQPLLYQVATAALTPAEIAEPIRGVLRDQDNARVFMDEVTGIDTAARCVHTRGGARIPYDTLVLATGARHSYFGNEHWAAHAPGLKTIDDAFHLRQRILSAFEKAEMAEEPEDRAALLTFLIVGGGPTGVELAGAIAELARSVACDFHHVDPASARVVLVEAGERVLSSFHPDLSERARRDLEELGVEVRTGGRVTEIGDRAAVIGEERIAAGTMIWAAGVQASPAARWLGVEAGRGGQIPVGPDLTVPGHPEIYAIGDTAAHVPEGAERPLPGVAPVAKQMGTHVGRRIARAAAGRAPGEPFRFRDRGTMATIGRNRGIVQMGRLRVRGFPGWVLWGLAHVYFLIGFRNRLAVLMNWTWAYATWQRGVRLITGAQI